MDLDSLLCNYCTAIMESTAHVFFQCNVACAVWRGIGLWIGDCSFQPTNMVDLYTWIDNKTGDLKKRSALLAISYTSIWVLWTYRNDVAFQSNKYRKDTILEIIKLYAFNWLCSKNSNNKIDWIVWLINPMAM